MCPEVLNKADDFGNTALHYAAQAGNVALVTFFCAQPSLDINCKNKHGHAPLALAWRTFCTSKSPRSLALNLLQVAVDQSLKQKCLSTDLSQLGYSPIATLQLLLSHQDFPEQEREPIKRKLTSYLSGKGDIFLAACTSGQEEFASQAIQKQNSDFFTEMAKGHRSLFLERLKQGTRR